MKPAWQVMEGTPSIRTLFLCVSANSPFSLLCFLLSPLPFLHLPGRLSSNFGVFSLNGHLYQTVFSLKLTPRQCRTHRPPPPDLPLQELFPVIHLLFSLTLSMLDISMRHTMVAVLVPCVLDSGLNV